MGKFSSEQIKSLITNIRTTIKLVSITVSFLLILILLNIFKIDLGDYLSWSSNEIYSKKEKAIPDTASIEELWQAPDFASLSDEEIKFGQDLIAQTALYLGPKGSLRQITNGMNCQNCHLEAGTKPFGNNYSAVAPTYPKFRARSGTVESIEKRVNDCLERSLNGRPLSEDSREMKAIVRYIQWLGQNVPKGTAPRGSGLVEVPYLDRPADPEKGRLVYEKKCQNCHMPDGQGMKFPDGVTYQYPPLWGPNSYNTGAGLYRLSRFAGFVKANMPLGASHDQPQLRDEEAWDVAAFVNSQPRPKFDISKDWPDISKKPIDHPFGPFSDTFPEIQHKYGIFGPIKKFYKDLEESKKLDKKGA